MDEPYEYPDGSPVNNASRSYGGETTIRKAIQNSINVVAVKCLEQVTPALGLKYLDDFGFTTLAHGTEADKDANGNIWSDANLATALGGITKGVKNVELCAAYAAIANGGNYIKPIYYTQILDHDGNVLIENSSVSRSVIKDSTAYLLTSAMEDVVKKGTGTACQLDNMTVAGKTGTTEDYNDLWFVGYTPYYTCAVWSGYDNNEKIPEDARNFHKNLWKKVMTRIHEGLEDRDFDMPSSVEKASVCAETGLLPRSGCPTITEYFDISSLPTEYCDQHFYGSSDYDEEDYYYILALPPLRRCDASTEDQNKDRYRGTERTEFPMLEGKRVGLITNPTGVDNRMRSTIDILHEAPNVNLVALYGPEHGVRGDVHAGDHVTDIKDATTGLPVYSLYGKTRKATPDMLKDVDVLVYDIQDIGCRSFTYISTMGLAMEAAAENGKEFIVLDRPNPVGGLKIEGNLVEDDCISFVSQFKIPYLYALTCGELALMLNGEKMLKDGEQCNLHIVKMKGWKRKMDYTQTGLQWVPSSPHIPHPHSAFFYPSAAFWAN